MKAFQANEDANVLEEGFNNILGFYRGMLDNLNVVYCNERAKMDYIESNKKKRVEKDRKFLKINEEITELEKRKQFLEVVAQYDMLKGLESES